MPTLLERAPSWLKRPAGVITLNGAALAFVLFHALIDVHIGLYGPSSEVMTLAQAANASRIALTAGGWMTALAVGMRGSRTGTACALASVVVWVLVLNGLVAFLAAPPPSAAFPYQDIAHAGSLLFGGLATLALWGQLGDQAGTIHRGYLVLALAWLLLFAPALGLFASPLMQ